MELQKQKYPFDYDTKMIFDAYEIVVKFTGIPQPEEILNNYDELIKMNLDSLELSVVSELLPGYEEENGYLSKKLNSFSYEETLTLNRNLNIKINLYTPELIDVLLFHKIFFVNDYGECFNHPIKEVW